MNKLTKAEQRLIEVAKEAGMVSAYSQGGQWRFSPVRCDASDRHIPAMVWEGWRPIDEFLEQSMQFDEDSERLMRAAPAGSWVLCRTHVLEPGVLQAMMVGVNESWVRAVGQPDDLRMEIPSRYRSRKA